MADDKDLEKRKKKPEPEDVAVDESDEDIDDDESSETSVRPVDEDEEIDRFRGRDERESEPESEREPERDAGRPERRESERRRRFDSAEELLAGELAGRMQNANPRLRALLKGLIQVSLKGGDDAYHLDGRGDQPKSGKGAVDSPDCKIILAERDLLRIAAGDLNPQIAMLSDKVKVEGRPELAVYFFNLVTPGTGR